MTTASASTLTISERVATELRAAAARRNMSGAALARLIEREPLWVQRRLSGVVECTLEDVVTICGGLGAHVLDVVAQVLIDAGTITPDHHRGGTDEQQ